MTMTPPVLRLRCQWSLTLRALKWGIVAGLCLPIGAVMADPVRDAMQGYVEFATYDAGIIRPEQITQEIFDSLIFIDTRSAEEFAASTIPGATHIEWREIIGRLEEVPADGKVVLFCNTGALSAQAAFGLRVLGHENVLVLQTGYHGWLTDAAYPATH